MNTNDDEWPEPPGADPEADGEDEGEQRDGEDEEQRPRDVSRFIWEEGDVRIVEPSGGRSREDVEACHRYLARNPFPRPKGAEREDETDG